MVERRMRENQINKCQNYVSTVNVAKYTKHKKAVNIFSFVTFRLRLRMMDPDTLSALSDDPQSGIKSVTKRVTIVLTSSPELTIKENLLNNFNENLRKFYPDIGGILLGYKNVKYSKVNFDWSQGDSDDIVTVKVLAKFFIFSPDVGSTVWCTVRDRSKDRVTCLARGHFPVMVYNPGASWDAVSSGDLVLVEVQVFSMLANSDPVIIGVIRKHRSAVKHVISFEDSDTEGQEDEAETSQEGISKDFYIFPGIRVLTDSK